MLVPAHLVVFLWLSCGDVLQAAGRAVLNFQTEEFQGGKLLRGVVFNRSTCFYLHHLYILHLEKAFTATLSTEYNVFSVTAEIHIIYFLLLKTPLLQPAYLSVR